MGTHFTLGDIGRRHGIPTWMVRRLFERHILPEPARVGIFRVIPESELPRVEAALAAAGYIRQGAGNVA